MARGLARRLAMLAGRRQSAWTPALVGAAVGLLVGAAAALLLAPSRGEDLRAELADKLARAREKLARSNGDARTARGEETGG